MKEELTPDELDQLESYIKGVAAALDGRWRNMANSYEDLVQIGWETYLEKRDKILELPFRKALAYFGSTFTHKIQRAEGIVAKGVYKVKPWLYEDCAPKSEGRKDASYEDIIVDDRPFSDWARRKALLRAFLLEYFQATQTKRRKTAYDSFRAALDGLTGTEARDERGICRTAYYKAKDTAAIVRQEIGEGATFRDLEEFLRDKKRETIRRVRYKRSRSTKGTWPDAFEWKYEDVLKDYE